jgi:hypothetical protein
LFWQAKKGVSFVLAFESARERNAAIMLARRFAFDCNVSVSKFILDSWIKIVCEADSSFVFRHLPQMK